MKSKKTILCFLIIPWDCRKWATQESRAHILHGYVHEAFQKGTMLELKQASVCEEGSVDKAFGLQA